jgi:hypothetical protein
MTTKAEFNAEEWSKVATGPFVAGLAVIAADRGGTVRESMELARVIAEEQQAGDTPELIGELLRERPDAQSLMGEQQDRSPQGLQLRVHETLRDAVDLLQSKATPEEVEAYKQLCLEIGQRVAERTKSGGVLGIGGERVSGEEQAALDELRATLGVTDAPPSP